MTRVVCNAEVCITVADDDPLADPFGSNSVSTIDDVASPESTPPAKGSQVGQPPHPEPEMSRGFGLPAFVHGAMLGLGELAHGVKQEITALASDAVSGFKGKGLPESGTMQAMMGAMPRLATSVPEMVDAIEHAGQWAWDVVAHGGQTRTPVSDPMAPLQRVDKAIAQASIDAAPVTLSLAGASTLMLGFPVVPAAGLLAVDPGVKSLHAIVERRDEDAGREGMRSTVTALLPFTPAVLRAGLPVARYALKSGMQVFSYFTANDINVLVKPGRYINQPHAKALFEAVVKQKAEDYWILATRAERPSGLVFTDWNGPQLRLKAKLSELSRGIEPEMNRLSTKYFLNSIPWNERHVLRHLNGVYTRSKDIQRWENHARPTTPEFHRHMGALAESVKNKAVAEGGANPYQLQLVKKANDASLKASSPYVDEKGLPIWD